MININMSSSSNNSCSVLILCFSLLLLLVLDSAALTSLRSCPSKCGGIEIPYPFGIGEGCYLEKWYEIECMHTSNNSGKLVPFLSVIHREVVSITLPRNFGSHGYEEVDSDGSVSIKNPITSKGCSIEGEEELGSLLNFKGTPFYVSPKNTLIAVGCNNTASLTHIESSVVGCKISCGTSYHTPTQEYLASTVTCNDIDGSPKYCNERSTTSQFTMCDGILCCEANMPDTIQQIVGVRIYDNSDTATRGGCRVAFLTDDAYIYSNGSDPQRIHAKGYATVELGWFIHTTNRSFLKSLGCYDLKAYRNLTSYKEEYRINCVCDYDSYLSYARCSCNSGYEGNPYLPGDCTDINECLGGKDIHGMPLTRCDHYQSNCVNLQGTYDCVNTNHRPLAIGLGSSFGSLIFLGGIY